MINLIEYFKKYTLSYDSLKFVLYRNLENMENQIKKIYSEAPKKYRYPLKLSLTGGKRLRPLLACASSQIYPDVSKFDIANIMTILELIHSASLIHDDVIDNGLIRRENPTPFKLLGAQEAIRCGDYLMGEILNMLSDGCPKQLAICLSDVVGEMCLGELAQMDFSFGPQQQTFESYYKQIDRKTANLISVCCLCGGMACGLSESELKKLTDFGLSLGRAFQISDDILDYIPAKRFDKSRGQDLRSGIITLPMLYALKQNPSEAVFSMLEKKNKTPDEIDSLIEFALKNNGIFWAKHKLDSYCSDAINALVGLPNIDILKCVAENLSDTLLNRIDQHIT